MGNTLKSKFKKIVKVLIIGFLVLFVFRFIYGFSIGNRAISIQSNRLDNVVNESFSFSQNTIKKNYASKQYKQNDTSSVMVDQKYEKIADISTKSQDFDKEEKEARDKIEKYEGLIQFEEKSGDKGNQRLNLIIGVPPENFDNLYKDLSSIGSIKSKQITKTDKTNEYKELNARKASLEKIRTSLIELKSKGGKIEEYMELENRILDIEQQLQNLGVSLGDFDDENEFCTVKFYIVEGKEVRISMLHRVKVALEWTIEFYLKTMAALFFLSLFSYLILLIIEKLRVIEKLIGKKE